MSPPAVATSTSLDAVLRAGIFADLTPETAQAIAAEAAQLRLAPGETVFTGVEDKPALYLVLSGALEAVERQRTGEVLVRTVAAGEAVDELQVLAGDRNPVFVRAAADTEVARVPGEAVDALCERFADWRMALRRLHRRQLLSRLHAMLGLLEGGFLDDVEAMADWVHLRRGEMLFEQHDRAEGIYMVISGRVRTLRIDRLGQTRVIGESGRGELAGEMAFFGGDPRSERVQAVRDSVLVGFTNQEFERLVAKRPQILRHVTRTLIERLHQATPAAGRVTTIAVLPASPGAPVGEFTARLCAALATHGPTLRLDAATVEAGMAEPGITQAWEGHPDLPRLLAWLEAREAAHRFVIYEAEPAASPWTRRCLRQGDRVVLVAEAAADPTPGELERALLQVEDEQETYQVLVLVHPNGDKPPQGTVRWLAARKVREHYHLRWDRSADIERLARVFAGRSIGVVLGGGGARGIAHVGMLRAMDEAGIPVDFVAGTSMGAQIAAMRAMDWDAETILRQNRRIYHEIKPHRQFTVPLLSLVNNRKGIECGKMLYGEMDVADLWLGFFCISSNLTTAEMVVHRRGPLWQALLASASIPGFAVPVLYEGSLLADGALLNNLPTDVMRQMGCGVVIAAEVSVEEDAMFTCDRVPTTWEVFRSKFWGGPTVRFPSLMEMAMRASLLHSASRERHSLEEADLCLRPPIDEFGLMDFDRLDDIAEAGYTYAREALRAWQEKGALTPVPS